MKYRFMDFIKSFIIICDLKSGSRVMEGKDNFRDMIKS